MVTGVMVTDVKVTDVQKHSKRIDSGSMNPDQLTIKEHNSDYDAKSDNLSAKNKIPTVSSAKSIIRVHSDTDISRYVTSTPAMATSLEAESVGSSPSQSPLCQSWESGTSDVSASKMSLSAVKDT